jgi:exonuclease VII small subunit
MASAIEDQLSYAFARIRELEEELEEARDTIRQLWEGNVAEWEWDA